MNEAISEAERRETDKLSQLLKDTILKNTDNIRVAVNSILQLLAIHLTPIIEQSHFNDDQIDELINNCMKDIKSMVKLILGQQ